MMKAFVWVSIIALLSLTVLAADLADTQVDYFHYRELVPGEEGVIYKIKLTNLGDDAKAYEVVPDTDAVRALGTYRIDPSTKVTLKAGESQTLYFYLALEKDVTSRVSIPVRITSGSEETTLELAARPVGPFVGGAKGFFGQLVNIALYLLLAVIIIAFLVRIFRKKKKEDESSEVETYY